MKTSEKAIVAFVRGRFIKKGPEGDEETEFGEDPITLDVHRFDTTPAIVRRGYGLTLNLGKFESARIDVGIEVPCYAEDAETADEFAVRWVESRIQQEVDAIRGGGKKGGDF